MKSQNVRTLLPLLSTLLLITPALAQSDHAASIEQLKAFRAGGSDAVFGTVEGWVNDSRADSQRRQGAARDLAAVLQSDASFDAKEFVCRELALVGTEEQVPALAGLLPDETLAHYALMALARIPGNKVDAALRGALDHSTGRTRQEIMDTLGERRDPEAVAPIAALLQSTDPATAAAAGWTLAKINNEAAVGALRGAYGALSGPNRLTLGRALLRSADNSLAAGDEKDALAVYQLLDTPDASPEMSAAVLRGLVLSHAPESGRRILAALKQDDTPMQRMAGSIIHDQKGPAVTQQLGAWLPELGNNGKLLTLAALRDQGDAAAAPSVAPLLKSTDAAVRLAALDTLGAVGDASAVPALLDAASTGTLEERKIALSGLAELRGAGVDAKLLAMLNGAPPAVQVALIESLGQRHVSSAAPQLLQEARSPQAEVRDAATRVLQDVGRPDQVPQMLHLLLASPSADRDAMMETLATIARRGTDEDARTGAILTELSKAATPADTADLLTLLGQIGGPRALDKLRKATVDGAPEVRLAALNQLSVWPTDEPLPDLLNIARTAPDAKLKAIALRGYVGMIGQNLQRSPDEMLALLRGAAALGSTTDQKLLILSGVAKVPSASALDYAATFLTDPALRAEAELAVVAIGASAPGLDQDKVKTILGPIAANSALPDTRTRAQAVLAQIEKRSTYLTAWQVSPAYQQAGADWQRLFNMPFPPEQPGHENDDAWRPMPVGTNPDEPWLLDLLALWGGEQKVAYLRTAVWSDTERDLTLQLGSDDGVKAWWNGKVVVSDNTPRAVAPDQDKAQVQVLKGWNSLLLKISQNNQGWAAVARFTNPDGTPATGLRTEAVPQAVKLQWVAPGQVSVPGAQTVASAPATEPSVNLIGTPSPIRFHKITLNETVDFEAACAADINGDGKLDIVSGDTWYEAPNWTPHKFRDVGDWGKGPNESGYRRDFADLPLDVNGDGKIDIVTCDYASGEISWCENTGDKTPWPTHLIAKPGSMETMVFAPFLGPGTHGVLPNCAGKVVWYELRKAGPEPQWVEHVVGTEGAGHGVGWGDVNGDGKVDIVTPRGWYEQVDAKNDKWIWHGDWNCNPGSVSIGMPVLDVDGDGRNDVVWGNGHGYGMFWLQQMPPGSAQKWTQHTIDNSWGQAHALMLEDIEGNRHPVVVTGKRFKAHDTDPSVADPLGLYYYEYDRTAGAWKKYVIDQGTHTGTGLQLTAVDLRHTGRLDIIAPGKSGLYLFENEGAR